MGKAYFKVPFDYDTDPERFRTNVQVAEKYGRVRDVHEALVSRLIAEAAHSVLDLGCGEGRFLHPARAQGLPTIGLDYSATMLQAIPDPRLQGNGQTLPFSDKVFGAVVALYMLYHLPNPSQAIAESHRVLKQGGLFAASAPSQYNDPELATVLSSTPITFNAENGLDLIKNHFQDVEVERWDAPLINLPDKVALEMYLRGRQLKMADVRKAIKQIQTPLTLTKRGALFIGRK